MPFPLATYPKALQDRNSNNFEVFRKLEEQVDDTKADILCAPLSFSLHCQEGSLALNHFNASKLKEQLRYWQLLSKIMEFSSTTHSSS